VDAQRLKREEDRIKKLEDAEVSGRSETWWWTSEGECDGVSVVGLDV